MNIAVIGLWHLGCVTAACLANANFKVLAYDPNVDTVNKLQQANAPVFEPGLEQLLHAGKQSGNLRFTANSEQLADADILWITFDTPVDEDDIADVNFVMDNIEAILPHVRNHALILISSQIPAGSTRKLISRCQQQWPDKKITFAVSPENLRLGKAIAVFTQQERIVVGLQSQQDKARIEKLLRPFTDNIIWMSIESAEMSKHALNAFLAASVVFINELATLCEKVGADAHDVARGLLSEDRIGPKAYLKPGGPIGGGTLARDVNYLLQIGRQQELATPFFSGLLESNNDHKQWARRKILQVLPNLQNKTIALLGLTYKINTDTLRRSVAIELGTWLKEQGATVVAYDPAISNLPENLANHITLAPSLSQVLENADALIIKTPWPQFSELTVEQLVSNMKVPLVLDPAGFLTKQLSGDVRLHYYSVGISL